MSQTTSKDQVDFENYLIFFEKPLSILRGRYRFRKDPDAFKVIISAFENYTFHKNILNYEQFAALYTKAIIYFGTAATTINIDKNYLTLRNAQKLENELVRAEKKVLNKNAENAGPEDKFLDLKYSLLKVSLEAQSECVNFWYLKNFHNPKIAISESNTEFWKSLYILTNFNTSIAKSIANSIQDEMCNRGILSDKNKSNYNVALGFNRFKTTRFQKLKNN